jgi:hypothetical protein
MDWLSSHKVLNDCAKKSLKLTIEAGKELVYEAEPLVTSKGETNHLKLNKLEVGHTQNVWIVDQYPDVFFWKNCQVCRLTVTLNLSLS